MKTYRIILFCLLIFNVLNSFSQTKHALIVAIGSFQEANIPAISSTNDVAFVKNALVKHGFRIENIISLVNENATKDLIINELQTNLISKIKEGDVVIIHFSSHGIGIKDQNGDETDGTDETIVCYDTPYFLPKNYLGEKHLTDDELNILLTKIRTKLGKKGQVLLQVDACYSGTISRGNERFRSFISPNEDKTVSKGSEPSPLKMKTPGLIESQAFDINNLASLVVISASSAYETNSETSDMQGNAVGSLSYAFSKAMQRSSNSNYAMLFDGIKSEMAIIVPRQTPQIEGDVNEAVFNNSSLGAKNENKEWYKAKNYLSDTTFVLNAGGLAEIMEGSLVELVANASNSSDSNVVLATGKVISANEFESQILLSQSLTETEIMQANVLITSRSFAGLHQKVLLSLKNSKQIETLLANEKIIQFIKPENIFSADVLVEEYTFSKEKSKLVFLFKNIDDSVFVNLPDTKPETIAEIVKNKVFAYAKSNYLRAISQLNPNLNVELKIIPINYEIIGEEVKITKKFDEKSIISDGGQLFLKEGSVFILRAINKGSEKAYLNIIDIQPNNDISLLLPNENLQAEDLFLNPNDSIDFEEYIFQVSPPYGADMLKLIASQKPMPNLVHIFSNTPNRSLSTTKSNSPFEILLHETHNNESRSLKKINIPANDMNVCTKIIQVVKSEK